jgi:hypothetical protein
LAFFMSFTTDTPRRRLFGIRSRRSYCHTCVHVCMRVCAWGLRSCAWACRVFWFQWLLLERQRVGRPGRPHDEHGIVLSEHADGEHQGLRRIPRVASGL